MEKSPLSIVVIAKNEEKRLPDCLKNADFAQEIIVLDDNSTDRTVEIAKQLGAKVFHRTMDNEGRHRNYAISLATQPWIFSLDADERITPELAESIQKICQEKDNPHVAYDVFMKQFIGSEWIKGAGYYPAPRTKMFRKGQFSYKEEEVHPPCQYRGSVGQLQGELLHFTSPSLEDWIRKFNRETSLEAKKWARDGRNIGPWRAVRKAFSRFLKYYFQRDGIRYGYTGFLMCFFHFAYQIITYAKYREIQNTQSEAK